LKDGVDWPGRGPTWLGVPALVVAVIGGLMLAEVTHRQNYSRDLLTNGVETVASSVQIYVNGKGTITEPEVVFRTQDGREVTTTLVNAEVNDDEGMAPGTQTPAAGTRYAPPLEIVYQPSDPSFALASVDARAWVADRRTPRIAVGMLAGGIALTLVALAWLSRDARRRGLAWWQWYSAAPGSPRTR
jgi:hypothetical protein